MLEKMRRNTLYSRSSALRASPVPDLSAFNFLFHLLLLLFHFPLPLFIEICLPCSHPYLLSFTPFFLLLLPIPHPFVNLPFLHIICISFFCLSNLIAPALCSHYFLSRSLLHSFIFLFSFPHSSRFSFTPAMAESFLFRVAAVFFLISCYGYLEIPFVSEILLYTIL